jgi:hypothetical protein
MHLITPSFDFVNYVYITMLIMHVATAHASKKGACVFCSNEYPSAHMLWVAQRLGVPLYDAA